MTAARMKMMREFARKVRGSALETKGKVTGDRRTRLRGRFMRVRGEAGLRARRFGTHLRHIAHR
jgi:uncharacterized protein YjbJ (UPF0337 family)